MCVDGTRYLGGTVRAVKIAMVANALPRKPVQIPLQYVRHGLNSLARVCLFTCAGV